MCDECISKNVVGHVSFNWSKLVAKFQISNHHVPVVVTGTRVNQGAEFGLEIRLDYIFLFFFSICFIFFFFREIR